MLNQRITKLAVLLLLFTGAQISSIVADERMQSQHFFNTFCVSCHGPEKSKGGLRLDQINLKKWNDPSFLDDIYTAIESEEMPPDDAPKRPEIDQIKLLEKVLGNQLYRLTE